MTALVMMLMLLSGQISADVDEVYLCKEIFWGAVIDDGKDYKYENHTFTFKLDRKKKTLKVSDAGGGYLRGTSMTLTADPYDDKEQGIWLGSLYHAFDPAFEQGRFVAQYNEKLAKLSAAKIEDGRVTTLIADCERAF